MKSKISARIIADSLSPQGERITTYELVFPRFILAELNTHRMFSKNSASSRAIPFNKMKEMVMNDPFIPIAWQKDHSGMQGVEYITDKKHINLAVGTWLMARNDSVKRASELNSSMVKCLSKEDFEICSEIGVTKQLCNRLLEPFMWHKVLLTATEFENFFELRCPQYHYDLEDIYFKSRKDWLAYYKLNCIGNPDSDFDLDEMDWYNINKSQAEIHIQALAEAMWDVMGESIPKQLKAGEWHMPYGDNLNYHELAKIYAGFENDVKLVEIDGWKLTDFDAIDEPILKRKFFYSGLQVATARCARLSYQTVGDNPKIDYEADMKLHNRLIGPPFHASPFEHCARAMSDLERNSFIKGETYHDKVDNIPSKYKGWCNNFRGFIQYRYLLENNLKIK